VEHDTTVLNCPVFYPLLQSDALETLTFGSGNRSKANASGGNATGQSDSQGSTAKAKREHPEAPQTVIGMQDERGGKGG
jgi:hypothetical protein